MARDYPFYTVGWLEHPDGGLGEYVAAPASETFVRGGKTYVKDTFLEAYRKQRLEREKSNA